MTVMVGADTATQYTRISAGGITTEVVTDTRDPDSAQHERDAHRPKRDGCKGCEQAYMQSKPARKGAKVRGEQLLNTVNGDLLDFVTPDNNGKRYGFDTIVIPTAFGDIEKMPARDSATTAKAWNRILARLESQTAPGRPEDWRVERFQHNNGTEFEGAFKQALESRQIVNTHGEVGRHTACVWAVVSIHRPPMI